MFVQLEQILISYAEHIHLAFFAPVVSFIEEVIPPIPSPSVMIAAGSIAQVQGYLIYGLITLALLGALGKTLGASVVYYVADKLEDILSSKIGKFIGITHEQIEFFGSHLGRGMRDYVILIFLRALPIMPSSLISVGSGLLKVNFKLFVISTFIGSAIRDSIYIYLGYAGTKLVHEVFVKNMNSIELVFQVLVAVILVLVFIFLYYRRKKTKI